MKRKKRKSREALTTAALRAIQRRITEIEKRFILQDQQPLQNLRECAEKINKIRTCENCGLVDAGIAFRYLSGICSGKPAIKPFDPIFDMSSPDPFTSGKCPNCRNVWQIDFGMEGG